MIASWNNMTWDCSPSEITFLEGLSTSRAIKTESNNDKKGKSPTEKVGFAEEEISLSTTYRVETGTKDIRGVYEQWRSLVGQAAPLIIGSSTFGPSKVQLTSVSISNISMRANGVFTAATLSFKFKEFADAASVVTKTKTADKGTAVNITASKADKKIKKKGHITEQRQFVR